MSSTYFNADRMKLATISIYLLGVNYLSNDNYPDFLHVSTHAHLIGTQSFVDEENGAQRAWMSSSNFIPKRTEIWIQIVWLQTSHPKHCIFKFMVCMDILSCTHYLWLSQSKERVVSTTFSQNKADYSTPSKAIQRSKWVFKRTLWKKVETTLLQNKKLYFLPISLL